MLGALLALAPAATAPLTFEQVLGLSESHPLVREREAGLAARRAGDARISDFSSNPYLQVLPGWRLPGAQSPGPEVQLQLSQTFNLGQLAGRTREAALAERRVLGAQLRLQALERRLGAARAWIRLWAAQAILRSLGEEQVVAEAMGERAGRALELGVGLETERLEVEAYLLEVGRRQLDAEGGLYEEALALAAELGRDAEPLPTAEGAPPRVVLPEPSRWSTWMQRAAELPGSVAGRLAARAAEARVLVVAASAAAQLTPTLSAQYEQPGETLVYAGFGLQLPLLEAAERDRALAEAEAARARVAAEESRLEALRSLRLALHEVSHTRELETSSRARALPNALRWVESARARYESGETDIFPWLRSRARLTEVRLGLVQAEAQRCWAEVKAWLLIGMISGSAAEASS